MRILIISFFFPPYNSIGAVRVGKTAKYLTKFGHDIRIISCVDQILPETLQLEIPTYTVDYTKWINVNWLPGLVSGGRRSVAKRGYATCQRRMSWLLLQVGRIYKTLLNFPDGQVGWLPFALHSASKLMNRWRPELIYASASPYSCLLVANVLSRKFDVPWIAELRDLWTENHNYQYSGLRRKLEERLERYVLTTARGFVTVSEPLAKTLRERYLKPVAVVMNGFDSEDYPKNINVTPSKYFRIVYTGMLYKNGQDPTPLFEAISLLGADKSRMRVEFFGRYLDFVKELSIKFQITDVIRVHPSVSYKQSLELQKTADLLLLILWSIPSQKGVYTGKLFEYIGSLRPILAVGPADNVASELIRSRHLGVISDNPYEIKDKLREWIYLKEERGIIPFLNKSNCSGLSREDQVTKLQEFILSNIESPHTSSGGLSRSVGLSKGAEKRDA